MSGSRHVARVTAALLSLCVLACAWLPATAASDQSKAPHKPFRIYGSTYYVGTAGLSAILVTSEYGHVLIDAGLPETARQIAANIEELGFRLADVKAILNSHPHADHAGGIAELQRLTGAQVYAVRPSEAALLAGKPGRDDPQSGAKGSSFPKLDRVWIVQDDQLLGVGSLRLRVIATPGHTPGGTSWTWESCEGSACLTTVYADSLAPVSAGKYRFKDHPEVLASFEASFERLENQKCELLLTPHPESSGGLARLQAAGADAEKLRNENACRNYAQAAREALQQRLAIER